MIFTVGLILLVLVTSEFFLQLVIRYLRKDFQWLITEKDENPDFDKVAFNKFIHNSFDKELGWVRSPNTSGVEQGKYGDITYHIDDKGSRENSVGLETSVVTFGDSYTFCRQVEDCQTWQVSLSERIDSKVLNFGVGNYGVDQAFLYYQRQTIPKTTKIVILGFVPETICRIQSYWKHYLEFGNIFAFKPKFTLENRQLKQHNNLVGGLEDFYNLDQIIESAKNNDEFYEKKFRMLQFRFPYLLRYFLNFKRNSALLYLLIKKKLFGVFNMNNIEVENAPFSMVMQNNIKYSHEMYQNRKACDLLEAILIKFRDLAYERGHKPLLLVMPQLTDIKIINKHGYTPYDAFFSEMNNKIPVLDVTSYLKSTDVESLYTEDLYGGHFSELGNKLVADKVYDYLHRAAFL